MRRILQLVFGFRPDLGLSDKRWHRLATVAFILAMAVWTLWFALATPADLPDGHGNIRIVETLADYVRAHPDDGDPVASFSRKYRYRSGKQEPDGSVSFVFFETSLYCAVKPYEHLKDPSRILWKLAG
ncbi:MAG: hypothetical protein ACRD26_10820, partial [Vicinamibacterales bacterium]